ncbi:MAG TPA: 4-hydroxyphenylacetate 3-hydroxylase N-terminal domain-containing protein [Chloroflexota bacterium]|nr:4-hydroxyphenylacetate 3-hydroxylase N-terminal domain-containing protein [Chloroflexota bacterium]
MRRADEYRASLRDGRTVFFRGRQVDDVTTHPVLGVAVNHAAIDYELAEDPATRELATAIDPSTGELISRYYYLPRNPDDLLRRSALIEESTRRGKTLVVLIKEIGTDALFSLQVVASALDQRTGSAYLPRVRAFYEHCKKADLALAVAQTDVKGDRSRAPHEQEHPDYYVHIVDRNERGIVVRGAKVHTSVSVNANEIIVLPTRAMAEGDADYAVSFAIPADTPGLKLIASPFGSPAAEPGGEPSHKSEFEYPISASHKMMETLTVFDDVFVPWERVFLCGEWQFAGPLALAFVEFHRFTAISYKLPLVDALVGAGQLLAEMNGIERVGHVREKLVRLIAYAQGLRALVQQAALTCVQREIGTENIAVPNPLIVNLAKLHFAEGYHHAVQMVQDLSGGLLVTGPGEEDWESPTLRPYLERFFGGKVGVSAEARLRAMNMVRDLTASDYGGYQEVLAVHAEGSVEAEKLAILRSYDGTRTRAYARWLAGLDG